METVISAVENVEIGDNGTRQVWKRFRINTKKVELLR